MSRSGYIAFGLVLIAFSACEKDPALRPDNTDQVLNIPPGFPEIPFPADNQYSQSRWELGKRLFYDPALSRDSSISCAGCHKAGIAFSDNVALSPGVDQAPGTRNAPTLTNVAYLPYFMREGGVPTLEMQVLVPIQEHNEFDFNIVDAAERLAANAEYAAMSQKAYDRAIDPFVITRAIANFERTLISGNSRYDQYASQGRHDALSASEKSGMTLFFSERTGCAGCHGGFNFTSNSFSNNGLYTEYQDSGRMRLTGSESDRALFKVPTLRNVEVTGPYMHDGSIATLEEVIAHYNSGGKDHPHKSENIKPLNLTDQEKSDLLAFLRALTDHEFIQNTKFQQ